MASLKHYFIKMPENASSDFDRDSYSSSVKMSIDKTFAIIKFRSKQYYPKINNIWYLIDLQIEKANLLGDRKKSVGFTFSRTHNKRFYKFYAGDGKIKIELFEVQPDLDLLMLKRMIQTKTQNELYQYTKQQNLIKAFDSGFLVFDQASHRFYSQKKKSFNINIMRLETVESGFKSHQQCIPEPIRIGKNQMALAGKNFYHIKSQANSLKNLLKLNVTKNKYSQILKKSNWFDYFAVSSKYVVRLQNAKALEVINANSGKSTNKTLRKIANSDHSFYVRIKINRTNLYVMFGDIICKYEIWSGRPRFCSEIMVNACPVSLFKSFQAQIYKNYDHFIVREMRSLESRFVANRNFCRRVKNATKPEPSQFRMSLSSSDSRSSSQLSQTFDGQSQTHYLLATVCEYSQFRKGASKNRQCKFHLSIHHGGSETKHTITLESLVTRSMVKASHWSPAPNPKVYLLISYNFQKRRACYQVFKSVLTFKIQKLVGDSVCMHFSVDNFNLSYTKSMTRSFSFDPSKVVQNSRCQTGLAFLKLDPQALPTNEPYTIQYSSLPKCT